MNGIGIGNIETAVGRFLARMILGLADYVFFRDRDSAQRMFPQGRQGVAVVPDPVFLNTKDYFTNVKEGDKQDQELVIGLNLNADMDDIDEWKSFIANLQEAFQNMSSKRRIKIIGLPLQSKFKKDNDHVVLEDFSKGLSGIDFEMAKVESPADLGVALDRCDIVVAERFHAVVAAIIMAKPFFALVYDVKVESLVRSVGLEEYSMKLSGFQSLSFFKGLNELFVHQEAVKEKLKLEAEKLHAGAKDNFQNLKDIIGK